MHLGNWQLDTVNGGSFRLDGGVVFGIVPKTLWEQHVEPDQQNRVPLANHCVLARDGQHTVLIDSGYGTKHDQLQRKFYSMEAGSPLLDSLADLGVAPEDVDAMVFSHLHFDHVCGAIQEDDRGRLIPTFPNAQYVIGRTEWDVATSGAPEIVDAYPRRDIEAVREMKSLTLVDDGTAILPGLWCRVTGGHTKGHLALMFKSGGETAVYPGDICPSTFHLRRNWHLAYDLYPLQTRRRKWRLLRQAADNDWWLLWNHDPTVVASRVSLVRDTEFTTTDLQNSL